VDPIAGNDVRHPGFVYRYSCIFDLDAESWKKFGRRGLSFAVKKLWEGLPPGIYNALCTAGQGGCFAGDASGRFAAAYAPRSLKGDSDSRISQVLCGQEKLLAPI
jgi:hypothetical protein